MSATADVLNGAADLIERDGWCQHRPRGCDGERCADNALRVAVGVRSDGAYVFVEARGALLDKVGYLNITTWNDSFRRTKAEVVHALRSTASRVAATERES